MFTIYYSIHTLIFHTALLIIDGIYSLLLWSGFAIAKNGYWKKLMIYKNDSVGHRKWLMIASD